MKSLNIKDPEAHRLAQAISEVTGESMTRAVMESLRQRHAQLQSRRNPAAVAANLRAIAQRASAHIKQPYIDHAAFLYDENGLPK